MDVKSIALSAGAIGILGTLLALAATIAALSIALPRVFSALRTDASITNGYPAEAEVLEIGQTGVLLNQVPQMLLVVRVEEDDTARRLTLRQFIDLGNIPRAGERVRILIDKADRNRATYLGLADAVGRRHE